MAHVPAETLLTRDGPKRVFHVQSSAFRILSIRQFTRIRREKIALNCHTQEELLEIHGRVVARVFRGIGRGGDTVEVHT